MPEPQIILKPIAVRRRTAAAALDCGETKIGEFVKAGLLQTIRIGADERILVSSLEQLAAKLASRVEG